MPPSHTVINRGAKRIRDERASDRQRTAARDEPKQLSLDKRKRENEGGETRDLCRVKSKEKRQWRLSEGFKRRIAYAEPRCLGSGASHSRYLALRVPGPSRPNSYAHTK